MVSTLPLTGYDGSTVCSLFSLLSLFFFFPFLFMCKNFLSLSLISVTKKERKLNYTNFSSSSNIPFFSLSLPPSFLLSSNFILTNLFFHRQLWNQVELFPSSTDVEIVEKFWPSIGIIDKEFGSFFSQKCFILFSLITPSIFIPVSFSSSSKHSILFSLPPFFLSFKRISFSLSLKWISSDLRFRFKFNWK